MYNVGKCKNESVTYVNIIKMLQICIISNQLAFLKFHLLVIILLPKFGCLILQ